MPNDIKIYRKPLTWQQMTKMAMEEEARKRPPMSWEVPVDQLYAPSSDVPITTGSAPGGAGESMLQPADLAAMVPWGTLAKAASIGAKEMVAAAPRLVGNEIGAIGKDISLQTPARAKELVETAYVPGMFRAGGESIPARELQLPNILAESKSAKTLKQNPLLKNLMGTSIGQGEAVREGNISDAIEAAVRAIRYERRLPKPKLPK